jgi:hypothetical protein
MIDVLIHTSKVALVHLITLIFESLSHLMIKLRYIGKIGVATQNVLAVRDFDICFTYVSTGQPGAIHDTNVLYNAIKMDETFFPRPPQGTMC